MRNGVCYRRPTAAPRTSASAFGSWLPTPTASDATGKGYTYDQGDPTKPRLSLTGLARMWPVPGAGDWRTAGQPGQRRGQRNDPAHGAVQTGGRLNPTWVELLMGFPPGWTDLDG